MDSLTGEHLSYIYNYSCAEEEKELCALEMRALFGEDSLLGVMETPIKIIPSRSPFIRERLDVICEGPTVESLIAKITNFPVSSSTFKVSFVKKRDIFKTEKEIPFEERRRIEREIGLHIPGEADLNNPEVLYGVMYVNNRWVFGALVQGESIWLRHQKKPHNYSTALNTRMARAITNIAVPHTNKIKVIDPCCGIGTILIEALSMGINIEGSDNNPLVMRGVRENIAHFNLDCKVTLKDIRDVSGNYDVAIIDLPYNLCSVLPSKDQLDMLRSARMFSKKLVVITIEDIDSLLSDAGFRMIDRCEVKKGAVRRQIIVCE